MSCRRSLGRHAFAFLSGCELAWSLKAVLKTDTSRIIRPQQIASAAAAALDNACSETRACLVLQKNANSWKTPVERAKSPFEQSNHWRAQHTCYSSSAQQGCVWATITCYSTMIQCVCRVALGTYSPPTYFFDSAGSCISKRSHPYHNLVCMAEYGPVDQCATRNVQE